MPQPVAEPIKKLRDEIAAINQANRAYLHVPKYASAVADPQRRLQRLLEIVDELKSLTDNGRRSVLAVPPRVLRRQPDVELNCNFVFGSDARFSGRLDPVVGLLHDGLARVTAVL
jgi:hypothetical protein